MQRSTTPPPKRVLIVMSTAGGGHKSAAQSISEALTAKYKRKVHIEIIDVHKDYAPVPLDHAPEAYQLMIRSPAAWKSLYDLGDSVRRSKVINASVALAFRRQSDRILDEHPADIIVSTYHFANAPLLEALRRRESATPFVTVVTDLITVPPIWFYDRTTLCIVPTPEAAELAAKSGLDPKIVQVIGMPVSPKFKPAGAPKPELKAALGWPDDKPAIIAIAGGEGVGSLDEIAENLTTLDATIAVITGKNRRLHRRMSKPGGPENLRVYGFVHNMSELMQAADLIVTKAGPGTIMEALNTHLPLLLYAKLSGQEDGNVSLVTDSGAGVWQPEIDDMARTIQMLLDDPATLESMAAAAGRIAQPGASAKIAAAIGKLIP